jgi:ABC-type uncharacterized transport system ATPase subunit
MQEAKSTVLHVNAASRLVSGLTIDFDHVTKKFGNVVANDSITCYIKTGGIHAFLGENGAGKSTLMKILAGYYRPDAGLVQVNAQPVNFKSPADARSSGIGMVHQQFTLVPSLTVLENIMLGNPSTPVILNHKKQADLVDQTASKYGINLDLFAPVSRLNMAQKQKVEILKLLWRDTRILVLDEPTSQLAPFEAEEILQTMDHLATSGKIVILITHHIQELLTFASIISVLRQGRLISSFAAKSVSAEELARIMIGDKLSIEGREASDAKSPHLLKERNIQIDLKDVNVRASTNNRALKDLSIEFREGEVHGIAGVMGSGQDELANVLTGHLVPGKGQLFLNGKPYDWKNLRSTKNEFAYIPSEPKRASLENLTLAENILLRGINRKEFFVGPFIRNKEVENNARERVASFDVRQKNIFALGGSLSGGNLQKLIIAREFDKAGPLMVAVNPTAGLDLAMSLKIRKKFRQYAENGKCVLLISPDLEELLETCDRISIMFAGKIVDTRPINELNAEILGLLMGGNNLAANQDDSFAASGYNGLPIEVNQTLSV